MAIMNEIWLRIGLYKNRSKLNYLLSTGRWTAYYCRHADENTLLIPKIRKNEMESKRPKTVRITTKPCFNETSKIYEYHAIEGVPGTVNWFGETGKVEGKEDRRLITAAIELGERIAKGEATTDLWAILKNYANWLPVILLVLQIITVIGLYVLMNP